MAAADNLKTYRGNCHCARFVYQLKSPEINEYFRCTCSICFKRGAAWLLADKDHVDFVKGTMDALAVYTFNEGNYKHLVGALQTRWLRLLVSTQSPGADKG